MHALIAYLLKLVKEELAIQRTLNWQLFVFYSLIFKPLTQKVTK